jgi:hypothetical protein
MSQTADHLLVIGRGRIIAAGPVQQGGGELAGARGVPLAQGVPEPKTSCR